MGQYSHEYTPRDKLQRYLKAGLMLLRGYFIKLRMSKSGGMLLIGQSVRIRNPQYIKHSGRLVIEDFAEIQGVSRNGIQFGNNVSVGAFASVRPSGYYGRDKGKGLKVGNSSNIGPYCFIGCGGGVDIGANVMMAPHVSIHSEQHNFSASDSSIKEQGVTRSAVTIEDDCWLATGCRIMSGITVGSGSIVAAGAVVTKNVPANSIVAGVPAKVIGTRD